MEHNHSHNHTDLVGKRLIYTIILNLIITIAQLIGGIFANSLAILSDALHNFSDVVSLVVSLIARKLSKKRSTNNQTFGYKRAEILAAIINSITLFVIAIFLFVESIHRFGNESRVDGVLVIWLALLSIVLNGASVLILQKDAKTNMNVKSSYLHLMSDMLTSFAVLVGGAIVYFYDIYYVDTIMSVLISFFLIYTSYSITKEAIAVIMQFTPKHINVEELKQEVESFEEIKNIHHLHLWQLDDEEIHIQAHLDFNEDLKISEAEKVVEAISVKIEEKFKINHPIFQIDFHAKDSKELIIED